MPGNVKKPLFSQDRHIAWPFRFFLSVNPSFLLFLFLKRGARIRWGVSTLDQFTLAVCCASVKCATIWMWLHSESPSDEKVDCFAIPRHLPQTVRGISRVLPFSWSHQLNQIMESMFMKNKHLYLIHSEEYKENFTVTNETKYYMAEKWIVYDAVSYTHLTLPTNREV